MSDILYLKEAIASLFFLSLLAGLYSPLIVSKRLGMLGEGVGHSTLLGMAISLLLLGFEQSALTRFCMTLIFTLCFVLPLAWKTYDNNRPNDSYIGIYLTVTLSLGVLLLAQLPTGSGELNSGLFGNILLIEQVDLLILFLVTLIGVGLFLLLRKKWIYLIFDPHHAKLTGHSPLKFHFFLILLLTLFIVSSLKVAGSLLINALFIMPGLFALKYSKGLKGLFKKAVLFSFSGSFLGLISIHYFDLPPGPGLGVSYFLVYLGGIGIETLLSKRT